VPPVGGRHSTTRSRPCSLASLFKSRAAADIDLSVPEDREQIRLGKLEAVRLHKSADAMKQLWTEDRRRNVAPARFSGRGADAPPHGMTMAVKQVLQIDVVAWTLVSSAASFGPPPRMRLECGGA
jgi:hypothetical protein